MRLDHLLTRSGLTYPEVSSKVYHDSFCQSDSSVSLPWVIYFEAFCLHVVSSFSCIPVSCPKLVLSHPSSDIIILKAYDRDTENFQVSSFVEITVFLDMMLYCLKMSNKLSTLKIEASGFLGFGNIYIYIYIYIKIKGATMQKTVIVYSKFSHNLLVSSCDRPSSAPVQG